MDNLEYYESSKKTICILHNFHYLDLPVVGCIGWRPCTCNIYILPRQLCLELIVLLFNKAVGGSGLGKTQDKRAYLKTGCIDHIRGKQFQTEQDLAIPKGFPVAIYSSHSHKNRLDMEIYTSAIFTANSIVVSRNEDTHTEKILLTKAEGSFTDESNPSCSNCQIKMKPNPASQMQFNIVCAVKHLWQKI